MSDPPHEGRPDYKVYRSRRRRFESLRPSGGLKGLRPGPGRDRAPRERKALTPGAVLKWIGWAAFAWISLSLVLFIVSAQLQKGVSEAADSALAGGGNMLTGSTVLVLGSDRRAGDSIDKSQTGPGRADSILLLHAAFGSVRKLSIPRDSAADIPGHGAQKINAAYALGGAALTIKTVERFLGNGLEVNHVVEVDFADFPELIDALGGITVNNRSRICSPPFDNFFKGYRLGKGEQQLDGERALGFARVRKNTCAPAEDDRDRAARQQEVLTGIRGKLLSGGTFLRLPWVSWQAPKTIESDMGSAGLFGLFTDLITGNSKESSVLRFSCGGCGPSGAALVADSERRAAVKKLLGR
ncbi:MAG: LCP family protein [Thermoleophilaceae bacterium]|nr:LCP family protein [Thermoleophilaceae bacterium]